MYIYIYIYIYKGLHKLISDLETDYIKENVDMIEEYVINI